MSVEEEIWKVYPGDSRYEVSSLGRVRNRHTGRPKKAASNGKGYLKVLTHLPDGSHRGYYLHRMVLETFVGPNVLEVSHLNGNPHDNRLSNLCYEDHSSNMQRRKEHGTENILIGEEHGMAKLSEDQARAILASKEAGTVLARRYNVSTALVCAIRHGRRWKHVR